MAGVARVRQVIEQAKTTFTKSKGDSTFQEEFERLKSLVSWSYSIVNCRLQALIDTQRGSNTVQQGTNLLFSILKFGTKF